MANSATRSDNGGTFGEESTSVFYGAPIKHFNFDCVVDKSFGRYSLYDFVESKRYIEAD